MPESLHNDYHEYLKVRSFKSKLYRRFLLYPKLNKFIIGRTLDLGAGLGEFLASRPGSVGVDVNEKNVSFCVAQGHDCRLMEEDRLPFINDEFDSIVMDNVLEHIADPSNILSEIDRVLKKTGILLVGVPGSKGYLADADHKVFYSRHDLIEVFIKRGYICSDFFSMPLDCRWLDSRVSQHCNYGVFKKG